MASSDVPLNLTLSREALKVKFLAFEYGNKATVIPNITNVQYKAIHYAVSVTCMLLSELIGQCER